ncbi:FecR domain-containing protein [Patescibacteria group bacterium]
MPRMPRKRPIDYILPFLIMICAGVIVVLAYQLWSSVQPSEDEKDIYMYTAQGNVKILPWGAGEWEKAYNGTRLLQGDSIKTQKGGRTVVEFFEDHYLRVDEKSEISISEIKESGGVYEISVMLLDGKIWINNDETSDSPVKFVVKTDNTIVKTVSTIYEVEQTDAAQAVRVIKGSIVADILVDEDGQKKKVESISIGVGQEALLTDKALKEYAERKSPSVIDAISDEFRNSGFYKWNMSEDSDPTDYSISGGTFDSALFDDGATEDAEILEEGDLPKPVITVPSTLDFTTPESSLSIRGTTSAETKKMMVDAVVGGESQTYELNLYVPGNTEWSFAISHAKGNMEPGKNTYAFYSLGEDEKRSAKTNVVITYGSEEDAEDTEDPTADDEEDEETDLNLGTLTTPEVETYNGGASNEVDVDTVKVSGSVSGAEKVVVNGYTLSAFEPGDTTWTYYAKESLGNLDAGENSYTVVAVAPDGTEKSTQVTITYNKPAEEPVSEEPATADAGV